MPLLCVLVIFGCTSIKSKAADAPGTLKKGQEFCQILKQLSSRDSQEFLSIQESIVSKLDMEE